MEKAHAPYSLFASALEEVSKCYKFSVEDALSFERTIDNYPVATSISSSDLDVYCERDLQETKKQRLYTAARLFLAKRRKLMDVICDVLARLIVHFESKAAVDELDLKRVRARYVKYSNLLARMERANVIVNMEDNIQKLMRHIQVERAKIKQVYMFVDHQTKFNLVDLYCDESDSEFDENNNKNVHCSVKECGDYDSEIVQKENQHAAKEDRYFTILNIPTDDYDGFVLYGMICI